MVHCSSAAKKSYPFCWLCYHCELRSGNPAGRCELTKYYIIAITFLHITRTKGKKATSIWMKVLIKNETAGGWPFLTYLMERWIFLEKKKKTNKRFSGRIFNIWRGGGKKKKKRKTTHNWCKRPVATHKSSFLLHNRVGSRDGAGLCIGWVWFLLGSLFSCSGCNNVAMREDPVLSDKSRFNYCSAKAYCSTESLKSGNLCKHHHS